MNREWVSAVMPIIIANVLHDQRVGAFVSGILFLFYLLLYRRSVAFIFSASTRPCYILNNRGWVTNAFLLSYCISCHILKEVSHTKFFQPGGSCHIAFMAYRQWVTEFSNLTLTSCPTVCELWWFLLGRFITHFLITGGEWWHCVLSCSLNLCHLMANSQWVITAFFGCCISLLQQEVSHTAIISTQKLPYLTSWW